LKIGMFTDSLGAMSFEEVLEQSARLGLDTVEFGCGNWSSAPHLNVAELLNSGSARAAFEAAIAGHGLEISALNCSGNQLHPGEPGKRHHAVVLDTIRLAGLLGIERVAMMSGCPGAPGDSHANWVTTEWPPEVREILRWQWDEVLIPYWRELVAFGAKHGVKKFCLELHGHQNVYSVGTLMRLRDAVGESVGANFDPSHLVWMGADPMQAVRELGSATYHVHAKDTRLQPLAGINGVIDTMQADRFRERAWSYVTLGYGHGEEWWRAFCLALADADYEGTLSIEHEDFLMPPLEGVEKSVALLRDVVFNRPARA
jgi:sugar phosphate isomerase/epimerase